MNQYEVRDRRRRERRRWAGAYLLSLLLHLLILLPRGELAIPVAQSSAAGPGRDDSRAAAGGMRAIRMAVPPEPQLERPRVPVPVEIQVDPVEIEDEIVFDLETLLGERPGLGDPGVADGEGSGDGGSSDEGPDRLLPPAPRSMIIPPANRDLRGVDVRVWVLVDATGRVVADSTRLDPPTRDRGFNRQLMREAALWLFRPGTKDGMAITAWFDYLISM